MINQEQLFYDLGLPLSPSHNHNQSHIQSEVKCYTQNQQFVYEDFEIQQDDKNQNHVKQLLELTISIKEGLKDSIYVFEGDNIDQLAYTFTIKHDLKIEAMTLISQSIKTHLQNLEKNSGDQNYGVFEHKRSTQIQGKENQNCQSSTQQEIFNRLHQEAQKKKSRQSEREMEQYKNTKTQNSPINQDRKILNDPNHQYIKAMKQKEQKNIKMAIIRTDIEEEQVRSMSFRPSISKKSLSIVENKKRQGVEKPEDNLMKQGKQTRSDKNAAEYLQNKNEEQRYSFKPEINKISERIVQQKKSLTPQQHDKYQQLYQMADELKTKRIEQSKQTTSQNCTFKPKLNPKQHDREFIPFLERVEYEQNKRNMKSKHEEAQLNYDPKNGQKFFRPSICRAPKIDRNQQELPIGQYLFNQQKKKDSSINQSKNDLVEQKTPRENINNKSLDRSTILTQNRRRKRLEEYFELMDDDNDGFISSENINLQSLPTEALEIFTPIFQQLEQLDVQMNLDRWLEQTSKLLQFLNVAEKNQIFHRLKTDNQNNEQFKPLINHKSQQIILQSRSYSGHVGLYQHCQKAQMIKDLKIKQQKFHLLEQEKLVCTFKPQISIH